MKIALAQMKMTPEMENIVAKQIYTNRNFGTSLYI